MATEAAVSDHSAASEQSERGEKKIEPEKVENLEPKEAECAAASSAESGEKIEPPPTAEEIKEIKTDDEPKAEEPESVAAASAESGATIEEKKTETPVAEEVEEIRTVEKPKAEDAAEPTAQKVDDTIGDVTKTEDSTITEGAKDAALGSEATNSPEPSTECKSELPRKVDELPAAEVETITPNDVEVSKISESIPSMEEKQLEKPEVTVKEPIVVDSVKDVEVETGIDKVEDSKLPIEVVAAKEETIVVEISDQVESDDSPEIKVQVKNVEYSPSGEVLEKTAEAKAKIIEPKKNDTETAENSVMADKSSDECEGVTGKAAESEAISRRTDLAPENEKKEETVASGETNSAAEKKTATNPEAKEADKTPMTETKLEEGKKDDEAVKADAQDSERTKDSEETKTSQDVPKEDVPVKTQKQSNNIIKMMKHSLGKAKKAIIGKSQNSKAPAAPETKDEIAPK